MAINNPYVPGDPYSYDLKWIVAKVKEILQQLGTLDDAIEKKIFEGFAEHSIVQFHNVADMLAADIKDGSIVLTLGYHEAGDQGTMFYLIKDFNPGQCSLDYFLTMDNNAQIAIPVVVTPYVTPEMFGAYGDGVTDDSEAVEKACSYPVVKGAAGKTYSIKHVHVPSNVTLKDASFKVADNYAIASQVYYVLENMNENNTHFENLTIDGNSANNTTYIVCDLITCMGENSSVKNCKLYDAIDSAIMFSECYHGECSGNIINGARDAGIYINANDDPDLQSHSVITNNRVSDCGAAGIALKRICENTVVSSNTIERCPVGVSHEHTGALNNYSGKSVVSANIVTDFTYAGILVRGNSGTVVQGNRLVSGPPRNTSANCILLEGTECCVISGNYMESDYDGNLIQVINRDTTPCKGISISGNVFSGTGSTGPGDCVTLTSNGGTYTHEAINVIGNVSTRPSTKRLFRNVSQAPCKKLSITNNVCMNDHEIVLNQPNTTDGRTIVSNNFGVTYNLATYNVILMEGPNGAILATTSTGYGSATQYKKNDVVINHNSASPTISQWIASADGAGNAVMTPIQG